MLGMPPLRKGLNVHASAVLSGYFIMLGRLGSFVLSHATVEVPGTNWAEPVLVWLTVSLPTGSGKSTHLHSVLQQVRASSGLTDDHPTWSVDDATCEKMGTLMHANASRLIGLYDVRF